MGWRLQVLSVGCLLVVVLLLLLLLCELQPLLKHLHHLVALLLLIDQLLVEDLVHVCDWLLNFGEHLLELAFEFRHDLCCHGLFKLMVDDLTHSLVCRYRC